MAVLLIGSTGNGKSTLGNFLIDPRDETLFTQQIFKTAQTNMPQTQFVSQMSFKVKKSGIQLTVIDTPGLNESDVHDLKHMIQIVESLQQVDGILACVLVVKFSSKIDAQYRATVQYYRKLFPSLFERNVIIVMTDYATDERSVNMRKKQRIDVDQIRRNTTRQIVESGSLAYEPLLFMIDCLPFDDEERKHNLNERDAILGKICSQKPFFTKSLMVAKTAYLKQEDMEKVRGYEGEVTGYNKRLQQANAKAEEALDKTQKKEQEITEKGKKLKTLQAELQEKNSTDLTEVASWSVSEKWKLLRYFSKSFDKTSPYEIDCVDKWTNGHCEWKDIIETRTKVIGTIEGEFMRGIYANVSIQSQKRKKYATEIELLNQQIREVEKHRWSLQQHLCEIQEHFKEYTEEMKLLEEFIEKKRVMIDALSSDYITLTEARERLQVLEAKRRDSA